MKYVVWGVRAVVVLLLFAPLWLLGSLLVGEDILKWASGKGHG